jgi:hypothetical protein
LVRTIFLLVRTIGLKMFAFERESIGFNLE